MSHKSRGASQGARGVGPRQVTDIAEKMIARGVGPRQVIARGVGPRQVIDIAEKMS